MKKHILLLTMIIMVLMTGCKKDSPGENKLVESIELPPLTEQFTEGSPITVKGSGFTGNDQIVFRTQTKATTDIVAQIKEVTSAQITFIVPSGLSVGENPIILKRGNTEQMLGSVSIAEMPDAKLYGFGWLENSNNGTSYAVYEVNKATGARTLVKQLDQGQDLTSLAVIGHTVYGIYFDKFSDDGPNHLGSFDFDTKTYKDLGGVANIQCVGIIEGKLHVLISNAGTLSLSQVNTQTGALTLVADFGKVTNAETFTGTSNNSFAYDAKNKTVLTLGWWNEKSGDEYCQPIVLNVEKKTSSLLPRFTEAHKNWGEFFNKGEQICVTVSRVLNYDTPQESAEYDIYTLNDKYELGQKLKTITQYCYAWQYDSKEDVMYNCYDRDKIDTGLCSFDFKTSTFKTILESSNIYDLVLVR